MFIVNHVFFLFFLKPECSPGNFGVNCRERCSGHCLNDQPCDQVNGMCTFGCQDGFIGKHCNKCKKLTSSHPCYFVFFPWMKSGISICVYFSRIIQRVTPVHMVKIVLFNVLKIAMEHVDI